MAGRPAKLSKNVETSVLLFENPVGRGPLREMLLKVVEDFRQSVHLDRRGPIANLDLGTVWK